MVGNLRANRFNFIAQVAEKWQAMGFYGERRGHGGISLFVSPHSFLRSQSSFFNIPLSLKL